MCSLFEDNEGFSSELSIWTGTLGKSWISIKKPLTAGKLLREKCKTQQIHIRQKHHCHKWFKKREWLKSQTQKSNAIMLSKTTDKKIVFSSLTDTEQTTCTQWNIQ